MCVWQAKQLATHISELETTATKSGHELETTKAENLRLGDELKVATQQLDMMREVTRQLYAKITEQTDGFSRLAEAKSTAEMGKHQLQQQQSDTRQKCAPGSPTFLFGADSHSEQLLRYGRLKLVTAAQAEVEAKLSSRTAELTQMTAQVRLHRTVLTKTS